jgi:DNA-binding GntR family transcriptional regulator
VSNVEHCRRFSPITSEILVSVGEAVTRTLREAILRGELRPGERLVQDDIATELGVSRQPVRDALRRLESEGLVIQLPRRGFIVREYREEDIRENYYLRQLLESEAARLAAERIQLGELEELRAINRALSEAVEMENLTLIAELNTRFHQVVHESSGMPQLVRIIKQLWLGRTVFTPIYIPGRARRSVEEHEEILQALADRNPERAASAMREHIARAAAEYFSTERAPAPAR